MAKSKKQSNKKSVTIQQSLLTALEKIDRPGTFCTNGRLPQILPGLEIEGLGEVALPLIESQAQSIKELAHRAPYGKGTETLVDTDVRCVWEIDAERFTLANPRWSETIDRALLTAQSELGLSKQELEAHLYKLLLYETGSFFRSHRDGEKLDRMVATLVITLPSTHEGGELLVRHEGREVCVDFGPESRYETQFAAFYADCEHEIRPVTDGFRLALVYNLTLKKSKKRIKAPTQGEHIRKITSVLKSWSNAPEEASDSRETQPSKLAILLEHEYTQNGLTSDALKGVDRVWADVLFAAASDAESEASLALVTYWESGSADSSDDYDYGSARSYWGEDGYGVDESAGEYTMLEVFDDSLSMENFSNAEGKKLDYGMIPLDEKELITRKPITEGTPSDEDFEGFTGNAGMTLERWYHRAAVVVWPEKSRFDVFCEAGVESAVDALTELMRKLKKAKQSQRPALKDQCLLFARKIIAHWPERLVDYRSSFLRSMDEDNGTRKTTRAKKINHPPTFLSLLEELNDISLVSDWIRGVLLKDVTVRPDQTLGDLCQKCGWEQFQDELHEVFAKPPNDALVRNANLLADWSMRKNDNPDRTALCSELAQRLVSSVEGWDSNQTPPLTRSRKIAPLRLFPPLIQTLLVLKEPDLLDRLLTYLLDHPEEFDLTNVQVPILIKLEKWLKQNLADFSPRLQDWLDAVFEELESRHSQPPQKPADWRRHSSIDCRCRDCKKVSQFLDDPATETLRLPLAKARRQHLHRMIDSQQLDTTHKTERVGSPYTLVLVKTSASFDCEVEAYQLDVQQLKQIAQIRNWHQNLKTKPAKPKKKPSKISRKRKS